MYLKSPNGAKGAAKTFTRLENIVGLRGRKFYGALNSQTGEYRVCAQIEANDNPDKHGLKIFTIPGGIYARTKIKNYMQNTHKIAPMFEKLKKEFNHDPKRPSIEFYRSGTQLICLLPIK